MVTREQKSYKYLIINTLNKIPQLNKCRKEFFCEVLILFLSVKGRINFLQLRRVGSFGEQRYRQQFEKPFAFLNLNKELVLDHGSGHYVIAFDPSYISKSGKKLPGDRIEFLLPVSKYLVADAWFPKKPFVDQVLAAGMHFVGRLRDDADLRLSPMLVPEYYQSRFQIEFLYRDGKQFTGLCDCQSRSENKLHFHFNMALTSINIAKIENWPGLTKETRNQFSMPDIKTMNHNRLLLNRFFDVFGLNAYSAKNQERFKGLLYFGTIAA